MSRLDSFTEQRFVFVASPSDTAPAKPGSNMPTYQSWPSESHFPREMRRVCHRSTREMQN